jgi:hypothetical protein
MAMKMHIQGSEFIKISQAVRARITPAFGAFSGRWKMASATPSELWAYLRLTT